MSNIIPSQGGSDIELPLDVADGGTGSTTAADARTALSAAKSGANSDITSLSALSTALSVAQGGTGSTTAADARTALSAAKSGANTDITSVTLTAASTVQPATDTVGLSVKGSAAGTTANLFQVLRQSDSYPLLKVTVTDAGPVAFTMTALDTFKIPGALNVAATGVMQLAGSSSALQFLTAGGGISVKTGTNAKAGTYTIGGGGTVTINTTAVTANSKVFFAPDSAVTIAPWKSAQVVGTSFTITGDANATGAWLIVEMP